jgi:AcrR family transcriptional regulator
MAQAAQTKRRKRRVLKTKAERQREIVDVTVKLLADYGIEGTSISRIADAVGMSKGALYYHFPNHMALISAAMDAIDETATDWITKPTGENAPARLLAIGQAHTKWTISARNTFLRPFYQLVASSREDNLTAAISAKRQVYFDRLVAYADEGKREGTIRSDVDSREIAWAILLHARGEDIAFLQGDDGYITEGVSQRILRRLLASYTVPGADATGNGPLNY